MSERGSGSDALGGDADADAKQKLEFRQRRGLPGVGYIGYLVGARAAAMFPSCCFFTCSVASHAPSVSFCSPSGVLSVGLALPTRPSSRDCWTFQKTR